MTLRDRIENGTTTVKDASIYELKNKFAMGILYRGALFMALFLIAGLIIGVVLGMNLP